MENQLRKESFENKAHQHHIKKLEGDLLIVDSEEDKGTSTQNLLNEKENTIKLLKKKLKISSTQLIQAIELTELEKEKEDHNAELSDCKANILKFNE